MRRDALLSINALDFTYYILSPFDTQVFETSPSISVAGSVVLMNLNGQAALEAIDPVLLARCGINDA